MVIKEPMDKNINNDVGESLMKKGDERVEFISGRYVMKVNGWKILPAVDFNKKRDFIKCYLDGDINLFTA